MENKFLGCRPSASDSRANGPGFDTQSGHILSAPLSLIRGGQFLDKDKYSC